jgi:hypothetical protein
MVIVNTRKRFFMQNFAYHFLKFALIENFCNKQHLMLDLKDFLC